MTSYKSHIALLLIVFSALTSYGQLNSRNTLRKKQVYYDQKKVQSVPDLLKQARSIRYQNPSRAIELIKEAIISAKTQNSGNDQLSEAYVLLAEINQDQKQWTLAAENYEKAIDYLVKSKSRGSSKNKTLYFQLGECHRLSGQTSKAIKAYEQYLTLASTDSEKFSANTAMGDTYYANGQNDLALTHYQKAKNWALQSKNRIDISLAKANIAKILAKQNKMDEAEILLEESEDELLELADDSEEESQSVLRGSYYNDISPINTARDNMFENLEESDADREIELRQNSIDFNTTINETSGNGYIVFDSVATDGIGISSTPLTNSVAIENRKLAEAYIAQGDYTSGIAQIETTLNNNQEEVSEEKAKSLKLYSEVLAQQGDYQSSLEKYELYVLEMEKLTIQKQRELEKATRLVSQQRDIDRAESDIAIFESESSLYEKDEELMAERYEQQRLINWLLLFLLGIGAVTLFIIYRNSREKRRANELLALKSLRSQMNPHFIFNALNSVNSFISKNDERSANKFLSEFSRLMRMVLENSHEDFVSLTQELAVIELYVKLEHYRFRDKFDYTYNLDSSIDAENYEIPPMLIQPFIENAVWHGLRYKEDFGKMTVDIYEENNAIIVEIKDDGIGRSKSKSLKTKNQNKQSKGLKNTEERLKLINKIYKKNYQLSISDLHSETEEAGTHVKLILPLSK